MIYMEFFENLCKREAIEKQSLDSNQANDNQMDKSGKNDEFMLSDNTIRNFIKNADIKLADYKVYDKVNNLYFNVMKDMIENVNKITYHRYGKKVSNSDMYLLENFTNQNMFGGNYMGYCDSNPGQCSDSFSSQCGGSNSDFCDGQPSQCGNVSQRGGDFCDGHPSQCGNDVQKGGFYDFCDGHPSQCGNVVQKGGFLKIKHSNFIHKNKSIVNKSEFEKYVNKMSNYKFSKNALDRLQKLVENDVTFYINNQNREQDKNILDNIQ